LYAAPVGVARQPAITRPRNITLSFSLSTDQEALRDGARELAQSVFAPRAARWDETEEYPFANIEDLVDAGYMGMTIPVEHGGQGRTNFDVMLVVEEIAKACGVTGRIVVDSNVGAVNALTIYGTEEQKREFYPRILNGDKPCIAITEPDSGSDATSMTTVAELQGDSYVINGRKSWITGARDAHMTLVLARVIEEGNDLGIGGFLVAKGTPGMSCGKRYYAMGLRGIPEMEVIFEDCRVDRSMHLVTGFGDLMKAYNAQRVGAGTVALGIAQGAFDLAVIEAGRRKQFGRPLCEFQGLQWMMADARIQLDAARLLLHRAACETDPVSGLPRADFAAIAKVFGAETAIRVTNDALQIFGASGYGRELPLERMARDARMFTIGGGTAQVQRNLIATHVFGRKFPRTA
jgi:3-sulfinopropanoyl-CoA desulfinase